MEEVTADDIRLALVPLSKKSEGLYNKVNMLLKCIFYAAERNPVSYTHLDVYKRQVATLRDGGFLTMDEDHFLHLTDVGREVAERTYERHCFFTEQLIAAGVDPKTAEADACRIEHIISDESFDRLKEAAAQKQE